MSRITKNNLKEKYSKLVTNAVKPSNIRLEDDVIPFIEAHDVSKFDYLLSTDRGVSSGRDRVADEVSVSESKGDDLEYIGSVVVVFEMTRTQMDITVETYHGNHFSYEEKVAERVNIDQESAKRLALGPNYHTYREKTNKAVHNAIIDIIAQHEDKK